MRLKVKYLITNLATKRTLNAKINEVKGGMLRITNLATKNAFNAVENNSNLVIKTDYNAKINEIEKKSTHHDHSIKYITTPELIKTTSENFAARLKQANLASKSGIDNFVNKTDFDNKLSGFNKEISTSKNKTKHVLVENELNELSKKT